mmetsp:Transcript_14108/g.55562  ORF Transcript_14108/g.55562 Transcript_14108/m.55562 type:complete len:215 (+) Transcript_14108:613-1257(+)
MLHLGRLYALSPVRLGSMRAALLSILLGLLLHKDWRLASEERVRERPLPSADLLVHHFQHRPLLLMLHNRLEVRHLVALCHKLAVGKIDGEADLMLALLLLPLVLLSLLADRLSLSIGEPPVLLVGEVILLVIEHNSSLRSVLLKVQQSVTSLCSLLQSSGLATVRWHPFLSWVCSAEETRPLSLLLTADLAALQAVADEAMLGGLAVAHSPAR